MPFVMDRLKKDSPMKDDHWDEWVGKIATLLSVVSCQPAVFKFHVLGKHLTC